MGAADQDFARLVDALVCAHDLRAVQQVVLAAQAAGVDHAGVRARFHAEAARPYRRKQTHAEKNAQRFGWSK